MLYVFLCLIRDFSFQSVTYALFDCCVYYVPFWYIRISFADTYHSDNWQHCKFWTRTMLCSGVTVLWILPVRYSILNGLLVAFICCWVLYFVALKTKRNKIYSMSEQELRQYGASKLLSELQIDILCMRVIDHLKISEICKYRNYGRTTIKYHINQIKKKLNLNKL